jgi:hypothetical protein
MICLLSEVGPPVPSRRNCNARSMSLTVQPTIDDTTPRSCRTDDAASRLWRTDTASSASVPAARGHEQHRQNLPAHRSAVASPAVDLTHYLARDAAPL